MLLTIFGFRIYIQRVESATVVDDIGIRQRRGLRRDKIIYRAPRRLRVLYSTDSDLPFSPPDNQETFLLAYEALS